MINIALANLRPGATWILHNGVEIEWLDEDQTRPTEQEIADEVARIQSEQEATEYKQQRLAEYPSIGDQLDALFHAGVFPAEMAAQIQAIKDKYPKS